MIKETNIDNPSEEKDARRNSNRNGFIVLGVFGGVAALLISVATVGAFAREIAGAKNTKTYLSWATTGPGFYDQNKQYLRKDDQSIQGSFSFEKRKDSSEADYYSITEIETPENGVYLVLPSSISNTPIKEISKAENQNIFAKTPYSDQIQEIYFKSFFFRIGENAFRNMEALRKVSFASNGTVRQTLADYSLSDNPLLDEVLFASTLMTVGNGSFQNDVSLKLLDFNSTLLSTIGDNAFENTSSLTSLFLPSTLNSIGSFFLKGSSLTSLQYAGTKKNFQNVSLKEDSFEGSLLESIVCTDGILRVEEL